MICGALQTLNEEACEDVLDEAEEQIENNILQLSDQGTGSRIRSSSQSSNVTDGVPEADVILLQASPLNHPYWQPVTISIGECSSASSSLCGTPVSQRKRQENLKPPLPPGKVEFPSSNRHFLQRIGNAEKGAKLRSRPASLSVADDQHVVLIEHLTPPASPKHRVAFRSLSADDDEDLHPKQPMSRILNFASSLKLKRSNVSLNEIALEPTFQNNTPTSSLEKLNRFKDRLLRSVIPASASVEENGDVESDSESTPLVSEMPSPVNEEYKNVAQLFLNHGFASNASPSNSSVEDASASMESTTTSPSFAFQCTESGNNNANLLALDDDTASCSSSISLTNVLEPTSNYYHLVAVSGSIGSVGSLASSSQESLAVGDLKLRKRSISGHFSRQDALDQSENYKEGPRDTKNPETTV